ncbi:MAG: hypothetical protein CVV44_14300 [Spirochaetae bacterium HGW-Spirochaetae-1]|jgi:pimeloyl-ACP methyl ester carboxylesterase|nr:MAG: hypothetical protein CVV44_14300 [Spirochaetae bacterium HGW-Spirochaetae-1]
MDFKKFLPNGVEIKEHQPSLSDGVSIKIYDFIPANCDEKKPVIVFIPGWISTLLSWDKVLRALTAHVRVLYLETREKPSSYVFNVYKTDFSVERLARDVEESLVQVLKEGTPFALMGSSLGSTLILDFLSFAVRKPLCSYLISPLPSFRFPRILSFFVIDLAPASIYFVLKPIVKWYLGKWRLDLENERDQAEKYFYSLDTADPHKLRMNAKCLMKYEVWNKLPSIDTPVVIIGARSDSLHEVDSVRSILDGLKDSQYIECASNEETHNEVVAQLIMDHMAKL